MIICLFSPNGQKVRSKVELLKYVDESLDLSNFDFKSGNLVDGVPRRRRRVRSKCLSVFNFFYLAERWLSELTCLERDFVRSLGSSVTLNYGAFQRFVPYLNQKDADVTPPKSSPHTYPVTDVTPTEPTASPIELTASPVEPTANPVAPPSAVGLVNGNGETSQSSSRYESYKCIIFHSCLIFCLIKLVTMEKYNFFLMVLLDLFCEYENILLSKTMTFNRCVMLT